MTDPGLASRLVNTVLAIKPLASLAKHQARNMMIKRAERIGVPWRENVKALRSLDWDSRLAAVENPQVRYPNYYRRSIHGYDKGDLCWEAALEQEVAAQTVHASLWPDAGAGGDTRLRQNYLNILKHQLCEPPRDILDLGCSIGSSTFGLQEIYPQAKITGIDLSPYYLAVACYNSQQRQAKGFQASQTWIHASAEATGFPDATFDLVSMFLLCHELPQSVVRAIFREARRLLRPQGHLAIMDMNPYCEFVAKVPTYVLTLLKSTEPCLDEYFSLDLKQALVDAGFQPMVEAENSPRHRTAIARINRSIS